MLVSPRLVAFLVLGDNMSESLMPRVQSSVAKSGKLGENKPNRENYYTLQNLKINLHNSFAVFKPLTNDKACLLRVYMQKRQKMVFRAPQIIRNIQI